MYNQYACHSDFRWVVAAGKNSTTWNIEPATPDKGYWGFAGNGCN